MAQLLKCITFTQRNVPSLFPVTPPALTHPPCSPPCSLRQDLKHGTTTGISADDRAATVRALADPATEAADFRRPGHIFPLRYKPGEMHGTSSRSDTGQVRCRTHLPTQIQAR